MNPITVLIVDDHMIVREGFRNMLELETDLKVTGEARDGRQAVNLSKTLCPTVILMDIAMPHLNGLEATRQILSGQPATRILILSAHGDDAYITKSIEVGAVGFLLKQTSAHEVCRAIRLVADGETFFTDSAKERQKHLHPSTLSSNGKLKKKVSLLTSREMEVLQLIAEGTANKGIAAALTISIKTVEKHREHLMGKLDIHDTAGLTRYAISTGVIESSTQVTII